MSVAAFVDAGYLYAAGSKLLSGTSLPRKSTRLDIDLAIAALRDAATKTLPDGSLLRIYWYDGVPRSGPTDKQERLAESNDVKVRLGTIAFTGRQKGVDSLMVTDLIELARNHAITAALLLSGDEDVRIGVQIAQSFGVRVHLLGIEPAADNQSRLLRQEADTTIEWGAEHLQGVLTVQPVTEHANPSPSLVSSAMSDLDESAEVFVRSRPPDQLSLIANLQPRDPIPSELDRELLAIAADQLGRYLEREETIYLRQHVKAACSQRYASSAPTCVSTSGATLRRSAGD